MQRAHGADARRRQRRERERRDAARRREGATAKLSAPQVRTLLSIWRSKKTNVVITMLRQRATYRALERLDLISIARDWHTPDWLASLTPLGHLRARQLELDACAGRDEELG